MDKVLFRSLTFFVLFVLTTPKGRLYIVKLKNFLAINQINICRAYNLFCRLFFYLRVKDEADHYQDDRVHL